MKIHVSYLDSVKGEYLFLRRLYRNTCKPRNVSRI